ncbi:protein-disulfide reductase DsbD domain-containing protein [Methylocella silvestris]|nr:protein-disulfide reductase DsbD domain-containing protein [Methylocella silvestris]
MAELRAEPFATEWVGGPKSSTRLIAAPGADAGSYRAGVEIRLEPGVLTYWRNPGEAGAPPEFNFTASDNVEDVTVRFPTPSRIDEGGADAFGYRDEVIFPLDVKLTDPNRPTLLSLSLNYAVCGQICIPVNAQVELKLPVAAAPPDASGLNHQARLEAAAAKVPRRLGAEERDGKFLITRDLAASQPTWRLSPRGDAAAIGATDMFIESPPGWYFESRRGEEPGEFLIVEVEAPHAERRASVHATPITVTLAAPQESYEFGVALDAGRAAADGSEGEKHDN